MLIFFNKFSSILQSVESIILIFSIIFYFIPSLFDSFNSPKESYNFIAVSIILLFYFVGDGG